MGCGSGKDRRDLMEEIDEIEEKKGQNWHHQTTGQDDVQPFNAKSKYAATGGDDGGDEIGDELAEQRKPNSTGGKTKKKKRDDDDDDDEDDAQPVKKDADMERLLESYKTKPKSSATSNTLYANKHTTAMRRNEQQREADQTILTPQRPGHKINMKLLQTADDEDLGGGDADDEDGGNTSEPGSPQRAAAQGWEDNEDVQALAGGNGFALKHKQNDKTHGKTRGLSVNPALRSIGAQQQSSITPLSRKQSEGGMHSPGIEQQTEILPGMLEDDADSSQEFSPSKDPNRRGTKKLRETHSHSTTDTLGFDSHQPTRNNSQQRPLGNAGRPRDEDEFSF